MSDLEHQLRECLSRHASQDPETRRLTQDVRERSRRLGRKRHAMMSLAVVPATAAVIAGSLAIGNHSAPSHQSRLEVRTTASSATTPSPSTHNLVSFKVCPSGQVPKLRVLTRDHTAPSQKLVIKNLVRGHTIGRHGVIALAWNHSFTVTPPSAVGARSYAVEVLVKHGPKAWRIVVQRAHGHLAVFKASRVGCVASSALNSRH